MNSENQSPPAKKKKDSEKEIKRVVVSREEWEKHRESVEGEKPSDKRDHRHVYCPSCGKIHETESKFCEYCGEDLEAVILKFKTKRLPIKYDVEVDRIQPERPRKARNYVLLYLLFLTLISFTIWMGVYAFNQIQHKIWAYFMFGFLVLISVISYIIFYPYLPNRRRWCYDSPSYSSSQCFRSSSRTYRGCGGRDCNACEGCEACGGAFQGCGDCGECR